MRLSAAFAPLKGKRARGQTLPPGHKWYPPLQVPRAVSSASHLPKTSFSRLYVAVATRTLFEGGGPLGLSAIPRSYADDASVCIGHPTRFVSVSSQAA
jgi:hypothetical protein